MLNSVQFSTPAARQQMSFKKLTMDIPSFEKMANCEVSPKARTYMQGNSPTAEYFNLISSELDRENKDAAIIFPNKRNLISPIDFQLKITKRTEDESQEGEEIETLKFKHNSLEDLYTFIGKTYNGKQDKKTLKIVDDLLQEKGHISEY